jgi:hypothetical protein
MKLLKDYITESEQWMETPEEGDHFALELEDDTLLETYIMEVAEDGSLLLDSNEKIYSLLENWNLLSDDIEEDIDSEEDSIVTDSTCSSTVKESDSEDSPVARAVLHRILMQHPSVVGTHGPEKIMAAVDELASQVGEVEEIGSSDVSNWTRDVIRMLAELPDEPMNVGDALDESGARRLLASDSEGALEYKVYLDREWNEYVVKFYVNGRYKPDEDYHTDDKNDAMRTAQQFLSNNRFDVDEAEYQGRDVPLNKPMRGDVAKSKVYVRDPKTGNVKKVNFGDPNMKIKKSDPDRRRSFRARHNCDNPGPKTKARYWSCRAW